MTDVEGRTVAFERRPQKFAVGNYILGFLSSFRGRRARQGGRTPAGRLGGDPHG